MLGLFDMGFGCVPPMVRCECWTCLSDMVMDVFLSWSDVSVGRAFLTGSDISVEEDEDLHGSYAYNQHEKRDSSIDEYLYGG